MLCSLRMDWMASAGARPDGLPGEHNLLCVISADGLAPLLPTTSTASVHAQFWTALLQGSPGKRWLSVACAKVSAHH